MWGRDRKNPSRGSLSGITRLAEWCQTVIPSDGFFYLSLSSMIDSFACIPLISESGFLIMQSFRLQMSAIFCDDNTVTFMTSLRSVTSTLMMANRDVIYNQVIPNTWKFLIFIFPRGRIRVCEIRFSSSGVICGNPYPVCKKKGSSSHWGLIMTPGQEANGDNLGNVLSIF